MDSQDCARLRCSVAVCSDCEHSIAASAQPCTVQHTVYIQTNNRTVGRRHEVSDRQHSVPQLTCTDHGTRAMLSLLPYVGPTFVVAKHSACCRVYTRRGLGPVHGKPGLVLATEHRSLPVDGFGCVPGPCRAAAQRRTTLTTACSRYGMERPCGLMLLTLPHTRIGLARQYCMGSAVRCSAGWIRAALLVSAQALNRTAAPLRCHENITLFRSNGLSFNILSFNIRSVS